MTDRQGRFLLKGVADKKHVLDKVILEGYRFSDEDGSVIWAGSDDGYVQVTENGGASWTNVSAALPERWITQDALLPPLTVAA